MGSQGTWRRQAKYARGSAVIIQAANRFILIDCVCWFWNRSHHHGSAD